MAIAGLDIGLGAEKMRTKKQIKKEKENRKENSRKTSKEGCQNKENSGMSWFFKKTQEKRQIKWLFQPINLEKKKSTAGGSGSHHVSFPLFGLEGDLGWCCC